MALFKNHPRRLTDGREVIGTLAAAYEVGVTPNHFPTLAKREGLQRFATRNAKGVPAHFWLVTEIESLKAKRQGLEAEIPSDAIVPLPYEGQDV